MEQHRSGIAGFGPSGPAPHLPVNGEEGELGLGLLHATEAAALACAGLLGKGDADAVSDAAGEAMRKALEASGITGTVVLSPRPQAHLPNGAVIGGGPRKVDLGVYPVEGASQVARGHVNALSLLVAVEPRGFASLPAVAQMEKFVAGPRARGAIDLDDPVADNLRRIAFAHDLRVQDLTVAVLERPRHQELIADVAAAGAGIGDLHATLIAACAVRCLGGEFVARLMPRNDDERKLTGEKASHVYGLAELAPVADVAVAITGVTGGPLLSGVAFGSGFAETSSLVMSSRQATVRRVTTRHHLV